VAAVQGVGQGGFGAAGGHPDGVGDLLDLGFQPDGPCRGDLAQGTRAGTAAGGVGDGLAFPPGGFDRGVQGVDHLVGDGDCLALARPVTDAQRDGGVGHSGAVTDPAAKLATPRIAGGALSSTTTGCRWCVRLDDRLSLVRKTYGNQWDIPGGYVDVGKSLPRPANESCAKNSASTGGASGFWSSSGRPSTRRR
jgi:hypothetical protein